MKRELTMAAGVALLVLATGAWAEDPVDLVNVRIGNVSHMLVPTLPSVQCPNGLLRFYPPARGYVQDRVGPSVII